MEAKRPKIQLFHDRARSAFAQEEQFDLEAYGGVIPMIGDLIVPPNDRPSEPETQELYEVVNRYFMLPKEKTETPRIALVVRPRKGRADEVNIL